MLQSGKLLVLFLTERPKITLVAQIHVKFGKAGQHIGPQCHADFHLN